MHRLLGCSIAMLMATSLTLAQQPPANLTANFPEGSTKSSVITTNGVSTVTDTVTTNAVAFNFTWDAENKSPFSSSATLQGTSQSWNTFGNVAESKKGSIKVVTQVAVNNYTAQKWIPKQDGGVGCGSTTERSPAVGAHGYTTDAVAALAPPLYGEVVVDDTLAFRIESRVVDVTGEGDYAAAVMIYNGTATTLTFTCESGDSLEVGPGETEVQWTSVGGGDDTIVEVVNRWEASRTVDGERVVVGSFRGHFWSIDR